jgi:hypothetical protein
MSRTTENYPHVQLRRSAPTPKFPDMNEHQPRELAVETISCIECKTAWIDPSERWRVYLTDDELPELVVYCDLCAEREFGGSPSHRRR